MFYMAVFKSRPSSLQAGNVVTGEMVEELLLSGADIIKVGIGPGLSVHSMCPHSVVSTTILILSVNA